MTDTATLIDAILRAPEARRAAALAALQSEPQKPRPGTGRQAADILDACPRTVSRYADAGWITRIKISPRRVRYDLNSVEALALHGLPQARA